MSLAKLRIHGILWCLLTTACASLPPFGADLGKQEVAGQEIRPTYNTVVSYFGYVAPGAEPDEVREGKKMYYLYFWLPKIAPEVGVRMLSPVGRMAQVDPKKDFIDPAFASHKDNDLYFDTWVRFERCLAAVNPEDISKPCNQWVTFGENDDSNELPANPSGQKYNSMLRVATNTEDPLRALVRGMYRLAFATYKIGEVQGTFLAQVGAPIDLPGSVFARNPVDLAKEVNEKMHATIVYDLDDDQRR